MLYRRFASSLAGTAAVAGALVLSAPALAQSMVQPDPRPMWQGAMPAAAPAYAPQAAYGYAAPAQTTNFAQAKANWLAECRRNHPEIKASHDRVGVGMVLGMVLGGVGGGFLGDSLGNRHNHIAATIAGAAGGAALGGLVGHAADNGAKPDFCQRYLDQAMGTAPVAPAPAPVPAAYPQPQPAYAAMPGAQYAGQYDAGYAAQGQMMAAYQPMPAPMPTPMPMPAPQMAYGYADQASYAYAYQQPMMMVPVMIQGGAMPRGRICRETVVTEEWVRVPVRRHYVVRHVVADKRIRIIPDKRVRVY